MRSQMSRQDGAVRHPARSSTAISLAIVAMVLTYIGPVRAADAVEIMVVGTIHMDNPGLDLHNLKVGDVLEPAFQAEIARVTEALARFKPTAVHVESSAEAAREDYQLYLAHKLDQSRNEIVQLGFRLGRLAALDAVHGADATIPFPYGAVREFAEKHGQAALLDVLHAEVEALAKSEEELLKTRGLAALLRRINDPDYIQRDHGFYRTMLRVGAGNEQPGADLLTEWYRRNFLICANFLQASKPGDRIVVFFGSGHAFLLRQCVAETPGLKLVEANDFLPN